MDEKHILEALSKGDQLEFERMFRALYKPLCSHAFGLLQSKDEAEEVVQSVFIQLWDKRNNVQIDTSLKGYLFRSVRNQCLNVLKHEKVKRNHEAFAVRSAVVYAESGAESLQNEELEMRIQHSLLKLPEQCRVVFKMSRFEELKYSEIAEALGISVKTVENQMGKALRIMRTELKDYLIWIGLILNGFM